MNQRLSPEKYIVTKGRDLPFSDCFICEGWKETGMATVFIVKQMPSGKFIFASYLIDIYCLGVKNSMYRFNIYANEIEDIKAKFEPQVGRMVKADIVFLHNLIYGAVDYAEELGFHPENSFKITENLLNPDLIDDGIETIEFGSGGQPYFFAGLHDNVRKILDTLDKNVGSGNYLFVTK